MTMNKLASMIAKREGKKSQVKIGDVREILKIMLEVNRETLGEVSLFFAKDTVATFKKAGKKK